MMNDFLDNLGANQYQKMHKTPKEKKEKDPLLDELEERIAEGPVIFTPDEEFLKVVEERTKKKNEQKD